VRRAVLAVLLVLAACASAQQNNGNDSGSDDDGDGGDEPDAPVDATPIDAIDASTCPGTPCSILDQCGCESTPTTPVCDLDFQMLTTGATKCRMRNTTVVGDETQTCTMTTTCAALHVCVGGRCRKYCDDDDDCAGPGGLCIIDLTQGNPPMPIPGAPVTCTTDCIPTQASNATCPPTWACHVFLDDPTPAAPDSGDERYLSDCLAPPQSGGGVGASCTGNQNCAAGLDCVTLNPGGTQCRPTCNCPGGNCAAGSCPTGTGTCRGFSPPVVIGTATYGTCF
jgi:hypothetical protein